MRSIHIIKLTYINICHEMLKASRSRYFCRITKKCNPGFPNRNFKSFPSRCLEQSLSDNCTFAETHCIIKKKYIVRQSWDSIEVKTKWGQKRSLQKFRCAFQISYTRTYLTQLCAPFL